MKKKIQKGFTLIELMIVVAIIGILASIALPSYQDYIVRSQVSDAVALLTSAKTDVEINVSEDGVFPSDSAALTALGTGITGSYGTISTANITNPNGQIVYTFTSGNIKIRSKKVLYTRTTDASENSTWTCTSDMSSKYKPKYCL